MDSFIYSGQAFVYEYVVKLSDVDQFKHMSFANYLKLMFHATDALFVSLLTEEFLSCNRLKLADVKMQFKRQTNAGDSILVKVNCPEIADHKFTLLYTFIIENSGELVGLGKQIYEVVSLKKHSHISDKVLNDLRLLLKTIRIDEQNLGRKY